MSTLDDFRIEPPRYDQCDVPPRPTRIGEPNLSVTVYANGQLDVFGDPVSVVLALRELGLCPDGGDAA